MKEVWAFIGGCACMFLAVVLYAAVAVENIRKDDAARGIMTVGDKAYRVILWDGK